MRLKHFISVFLALLFLGIGQMWAEETTIASWGKVSIAANTAVKASDGDATNKNVAQFVSTKAMTTAGTNCYYGSSAGGAVITFSNLDLSGYTGITMTFYTRASQQGTMQIAYSTNGTSYTNLNAPSITKSEAIKTSEEIPNTAKYIKLTHSASSGSLYFGTITIKGTPSGFTPVLESLSIDGDLSNKSYEEGQELDFSGLTVTGTYSDSNTDDVTNDVEWSFTPALAVGTSTYTVTATIGEIFANKTINNVTVTEHVVTPGEYTITFNNAFFGTTGLNGSLSGANLKNHSGTQNDITIEYQKGTGSNMYLKDSEIRLYNGNKLVVTAPTGFNITDITGLKSTMSANVGEIASTAWSGKANSVTLSHGSSSGNSALTTISITYAAIAPEVTVDPASLSFTAKQNIAVDGKTFTLTGANLTSDLTLAASEGFVVTPTAITAADAMAQGGVEVTVTPSTPTTTEAVNGTVTISGGASATVNLSMAVTPTYAVAIAVNDGDMGSATINGGTAAVYVTDDEEIALVATPAEHHEFVNWTVSDENIVLDNENAATTTALAAAAGTITANFQEQACSELDAPTLDEITKDYQSATIAWNAVTNAEGYVLNITKHEDGSAVLTNELIVAPEVSFEKTGLEANTQYDYTVMAIGDGQTYCDANNPVLNSNFTTNDYPAATLSLVENGGTPYNWGSGLKLNSVIALPEELDGLGCTGKVLVGWSSVAVAETDDEPTSNYWAKGADYTITSTADVLYAVLATEVDGTPDTWTINKDNFSTVGSGSGYAPYNGDHTESGITYNTNQVMLQSSKVQFQKNAGVMYNKTAFDADIVSIAIDGVDANISVYAGAEALSSTPGSGAISLSSGVYPVTSGKRYFRIVMGNATGAATSITVNLKGESSYSGYTTECEAQLPVLAVPTFPVAEGVFYESTDITISAATGASIYYTTDGTTPSSTNGTLYEGAITLNTYGTYNFKAIAIQAGHEDSPVAEATYYFGMTFVSVSDLYTYLEANSLTSMNNVKVTGLVSRITAAWDAQKGYLTYYISDNGVAENDLQMYRGAGEGASALAVGDQVTVIGNYTLFQSTTHEFGAGNTIVARTAAAVASVAIGGAAEKTTYSPEDNVFSHAGLTATATYNTGYTKDVTALATWTNNLENNTVAASGNVEVTATYEGESDTKEVAVTYTSKTLDHITLSYTSTIAYVGMALPTPTVTAYYVEDIDPENVTELVAAANGFDTESAYDGTAAGSYTINVSYTLGEVIKSAEYTVTVKSIFDNDENPHNVADATAMIIASAYQSTTSSTDYMWVRGIVSGFNGSNLNRYYISDDGSENGQLYVYNGKYFNNVTFTESNKLHVGDEVVVKATILNYQGNTPELTGSQVVSQLREPEFAIADIVAADEFEAKVSEDMAVVPTSNEGNAEFTLASGDEAVVTIVEGKLHAVAEGDAEITASRAATNNANALNYTAKEITFNVHVIAERTRYTVTFDANGGEGTAPAAIANQLAGATVDMPAACLYNYEGHGFTGWKVINLSTEAEIEVENDQFEMPAANVKIQAQWAVVATCAISFQIGGNEVATANAPQEADYNISQVGASVPGFTFLGWSETEYADEVETAPTLINVYHAQAGEETKTLYGIYSRLEDNGNQHYVLDYTTDVASFNLGYGNATDVTASDGSQWVVKAYKSNGMQINTTKNASIKVPVCPNKIVSIAITGTASKAVGFSAADYTGSGTPTYLASGTDATSQTLDLSAETVTTGYIVPKAGNMIITHIDVEYSSAKTYYTSSPVEKVTVTFALAGGEGGCQTTKINKGSELTICDAVPTKSHSEFTGWKNGDDVYVAGQAYTFNEDITLTAQWNDAATYTVTYYVNGSEDAAPTQEAQYAGDQFAVADGVTKEGYTFKGWLYNNKLYKAGAQFTMPAANVEFVANWKKNNIATEKMLLISDANGLSNGMAIALGCSYGEDNFAMAGDITGTNKYMNSVSGENITLNNGLVTFTEDVITMIAEQVEGGWTLRKDETHYLTLTGPDVKWDTQDKATAWTISFSNGNVQIASGNNKMQFNSNSPRFKTYTSNQTAIQLFGKATVVTENANVSDLGYEEEGLNIVASGDITLTIDEPTNAQSITATNGATVVIDAPTTAQSVNVEEGSKIEAKEPTTTPVVTFATTLGSSNTPSTGSALGSADNITLAAGGEIHYDITLGVDMTTDAGKEKAADQWHAFTVPFPVDVLNGIYNAATDAKLTNEVDYAIMDYHGDIRANGDYGWKKYRGTLVPGKFYLMTINGDVPTFRFKMSVAAATVLQALNSMAYTAFGGTDAANPNYGWNGIGNPSWVSVTVGFPVQVLDPYSYEYQTLPAGTVISASTPFFYKANATSTMTMTESNASAQYAPRRTPANEIKNMAVRFGNEVFADKLYVTASEDALNSYEQDKDLVKMTMSKTPKVAQIFGDAYGMKLSMVNTPLVNNNAEVALTLYAPAQGEYTISVPAMEGYQVYLLRDGAVIWNLSASEYTAEFAKGNNDGYSIRIIKIVGVATDIDNIYDNASGVQKVVMDNNVFILRGEQMFDVTGKMVK